MNRPTSFYSVKNFIFTTCISVFYLLLSYTLVGFKTDQLVLVLLFNGLYYLSVYSRKLILGFSIFIIFWIIFDYMKAFPNYKFNSVNIENLYLLEKRIVGISIDGQLQTFNEYFSTHKYFLLDFFSGLFYLCWVPVPLALAFYFFRRNKVQFLHFSLTFLLVNIIGFITYYIFPAAPPWYVREYGFSFIYNTSGNAADLLNFDKIIGFPIFQNTYEKSSNVFAAFPSLHASYPVMVFYYGIKNKLGKINYLFFILMLGIWFTAVYSYHHYIIDVMGGILCSIVGILLFEKILLKSSKFRIFLSNYKHVIQ